MAASPRNTARASVHPESNCAARWRTEQWRSWFCGNPLGNIFESAFTCSFFFFRSGVSQSCCCLWQDVASLRLPHGTRLMKSIFKHLWPQCNINNGFNQPTRNPKQTAKSCWDVSFVSRYNAKLNHCAVSCLLLFICTDSRNSQLYTTTASEWRLFNFSFQLTQYVFFMSIYYFLAS